MKSGLLPLAIALLALPALNAAADTHYVDLNSPSPTPPYPNWPTAATNLQDAVDAAEAGDTVLVTNGVYATGGRELHQGLTNRVLVNKSVKVVSVNGSDHTSILGYQLPGITNGNGAIRCVYLTNGAALAGFTLSNGATIVNLVGGPGIVGGAAYCESKSIILSNCVIRGNAGNSHAIYRGTLINCLLADNSCGARRF